FHLERLHVGVVVLPLHLLVIGEVLRQHVVLAGLPDGPADMGRRLLLEEPRDVADEGDPAGGRRRRVALGHGTPPRGHDAASMTIAGAGAIGAAGAAAPAATLPLGADA